MRKLFFVAMLLVVTGQAGAAEQPNILWVTCEDTGPALGCYGDDYAVTPNLNALAARGMRYANAISNAPVCAPARTTIISGLYPPSTGSEHMRSLVPMPAGLLMFPQILREAGYYATNNSKEDYNLEPAGKVWDESSKKAHYKKRRHGQPFFAVFNFTISHESQIRNSIDAADQIHDPAKARLPAYHPDAPEVRRDWAQYYDRVTMMDKQAGAKLRELEAAGLADDTIIFFFGDHGSGMPRSKRIACNSGLNVPFMVYFPPKWRQLAPKDYHEGGTSNRLISFVDLAPTMLSLAGIEPPKWMQGGAFCGKHAAPAPEFSYGFRGRMDERYDLVRSVRDKRFMYVRNFMPHRPQGQHNMYMFETPTTRVWRQLFDEQKLDAAQSRFWQQPREVEELYDLVADRDEVINLAGLPEHEGQLVRMRKALAAWERRIKDVGFLPEAEFLARSAGGAPYDMGQDPAKYNFDAIFAAANLATLRRTEDLPKLVKLLANKDSGVRYWGAVGLLAQGKAGVEATRAELAVALEDGSPSVQIVAAEALGRFGNEQEATQARERLLHWASPNREAYESLAAWNALDYLDDRARPALPAIRELSPEPARPPVRYGDYGQRVKQKALSDLK
jgi:uncharacterized sulfatase